MTTTTLDAAIAEVTLTAETWAAGSDPRLAARGRAVLAFFKPATQFMIEESARTGPIGVRADALTYVCALLLRDLAATVASHAKVREAPQEIADQLVAMLAAQVGVELAAGLRCVSKHARAFSRMSNAKGEIEERQLTAAERLKLAETEGSA